MSDRAAFASPPCTAVGADPSHFNPLGIDQLGVCEVASVLAREVYAPTTDIALVSFDGWDGDCCRPGWSGGNYGRTLAALSPTIYLQPQDLPLDVMVTENGVSAERKDRT